MDNLANIGRYVIKSATLPLAIGLKFSWFLISLLLYPKPAILGLSFFNPKDLPTKPVFERIVTMTFCRYILNLMSKKELGSFNDWIKAYFQSFIFLPWYKHFLASIFCKFSRVSWRCWTEISQPWKDWRKTLQSY